MAGKLPAAAIAALEAIYARLPAVPCKGLCAIGCGTMSLTDLEARRLQVTAHVKPRTVIKVLADGPPSTERPRQRCIYLTPADRCSVYAQRPLICRIWGAVKGLSCPHGCVPDRWLTELEFVAIASEVERLGGGRLLETCEGGLTVAPLAYADLPVYRVRGQESRLDEDAERTRSLRALHGGRILYAGKDRP